MLQIFFDTGAGDHAAITRDSLKRAFSLSTYAASVLGS
jgi:hypothetical protein